MPAGPSKCGEGAVPNLGEPILTRYEQITKFVCDLLAALWSVVSWPFRKIQEVAGTIAARVETWFQLRFKRADALASLARRVYPQVIIYTANQWQQNKQNCPSDPRVIRLCELSNYLRKLNSDPFTSFTWPGRDTRLAKTRQEIAADPAHSIGNEPSVTELEKFCREINELLESLKQNPPCSPASQSSTESAQSAAPSTTETSKYDHDIYIQTLGAQHKESLRIFASKPSLEHLNDEQLETLREEQRRELRQLARFAPLKSHLLYLSGLTFPNYNESDYKALANLKMELQTLKACAQSNPHYSQDHVFTEGDFHSIRRCLAAGKAAASAAIDQHMQELGAPSGASLSNELTRRAPIPNPQTLPPHSNNNTHPLPSSTPSSVSLLSSFGGKPLPETDFTRYEEALENCNITLTTPAQLSTPIAQQPPSSSTHHHPPNIDKTQTKT